jgi:hypothetical protein
MEERAAEESEAGASTMTTRLPSERNDSSQEAAGLPPWNERTAL